MPLGISGGRTFRLGAPRGGDSLGELGKLSVNVSLQAYGNAVRPELAANWQLRFLFPK